MREANLLPAARACLHFAPQNLIHVGLIFFPPRPEPSEHIGVQAKANCLLNRAIETTYLNFRWQGFNCWGIGQVDF